MSHKNLGQQKPFFLSFMQNYSCTQLVTVNHRRPFSNSSGGEEGVCTQASQAGQARSDGFALTLPPSPAPLKC